jgi:predicted PurR-regulated permease PerM
LTFVGGFLPIVGAIVSGAFAALVALVIKGPIAALIIIGVTIVIHNVEGYIVGPKVLGHEVNLHPVAIILVLAAGTAIGGIIGAFLAVPLTAILIAVYNHYHDPGRLEPLDDEGAAPEPTPEPARPIPSPADDGVPSDGVRDSAEEPAPADGGRSPTRPLRGAGPVD